MIDTRMIVEILQNQANNLNELAGKLSDDGERSLTPEEAHTLKVGMSGWVQDSMNEALFAWLAGGRGESHSISALERIINLFHRTTG